MSNGKRFADSMVGLVLRLILAAVFLWAGYPKLFMTMPVQGETAATLANLGLIEAPAPGNVSPAAGPTGSASSPESEAADGDAAAAETGGDDETTPTERSGAEGERDGEAERASPGEEGAIPAEDAENDSAPGGDGESVEDGSEPSPPSPVEEAGGERLAGSGWVGWWSDSSAALGRTFVTRPASYQADAERAAPARSLSEQAAPAGDAAADDAASAAAGSNASGGAGGGSQGAATTYTADQFESPLTVKRYHGLVLLMHSRANPGPGVQGVPASIGNDGTILKWLSITAAITELIAAVLLLVGLLTRLWALAICGVMLTAIWLTSVSPNIGEASAYLGFLPDAHFDDPSKTTSAGLNTFFFQLTTLGCAFTVLLIGAGGLSLDRLIFGGSRRRYDDGGDED